MFESDVASDNRSSRTTRRIFIGSSALGIGGFLVLKAIQPPGLEASTKVHGTPGMVTILNFSDDGKELGKAEVAKVVKTDGEWYQQLGANSFNIARHADTEMPYSGATWKEHAHGLYRCICCDTALFSSETKFESGTGWPSFWAPIAKENIADKDDRSLGVDRTKVECARCDGHLGHVFNDGPQPTGLRYCMNSASMRFVKS